MSQIAIRAALESALNGMTPSLPTAWENVAFTPPALSSPYQAVFVLFAEPDNPSYGGNMYRERGIMHVSLRYPAQAGDAAARHIGALLRTTFARGASFTNSGVTVTIERTPEVGPGTIEDGRWVVPVKIRFYSNIIS